MTRAACTAGRLFLVLARQIGIVLSRSAVALACRWIRNFFPFDFTAFLHVFRVIVNFVAGRDFQMSCSRSACAGSARRNTRRRCQCSCRDGLPHVSNHPRTSILQSLELLLSLELTDNAALEMLVSLAEDRQALKAEAGRSAHSRH